jgi:lauroyl/myristoyl acyltransferase
MRFVRWLPASVARRLGALLARCYGAVSVDRRQVVVANLRPVFGDDDLAAEAAASRLFANFGGKIADLLRYEAGGSVDALIRPPAGETIWPSSAEGKGRLLLTVHLGNWEFGAPLLKRMGVNLLVITLAEPDPGFTRLRQEARRRWEVETLVIGQDAFAFIEVLKRLQAGATIALLVDRPPEGSAVKVELFGRPFAASLAAAELARASGCALLPVALPWTPSGYEVVALPEVAYDRAGLGDRESRRALTQEIMRAFEPVIRQHADQWYHFVPIWPK